LANLVLVQPKLGTYLSLFVERMEWAAKGKHALTEVDFSAMQAALVQGTNDQQVGAAQRLAAVVDDLLWSGPHHSEVLFWVSLYQAMTFHIRRGAGLHAELLAQYFLSNAPVPSLQRDIGTIQVESLLKHAKRVLASGRRDSSTQRKMRRNEVVRVQYPDGKIVSDKFKRVQEDIRQGRCVLLRS
jgi:hypothetical protein